MADIRRCAAEQLGPYLEALIAAADAKCSASHREAMAAQDSFNLAFDGATAATQQSPEFKAAEERIIAAGLALMAAEDELMQITSTEEARAAWQRRRAGRA